MIFCLPTEAKRTKEQDDVVLNISGVNKFAWLPVKLDDGSWIWLESYWCFYHGLFDPDKNIYQYWYLSKERDIPSRSNHLDSTYKNIWCTKPISDFDLRHDLMGDKDKFKLRNKAVDILSKRGKNDNSW